MTLHIFCLIVRNKFLICIYLTLQAKWTEFFFWGGGSIFTGSLTQLGWCTFNSLNYSQNVLWLPNIWPGFHFVHNCSIFSINMLSVSHLLIVISGHQSLKLNSISEGIKQNAGFWSRHKQLGNMCHSDDCHAVLLFLGGLYMQVW